MKKRMLKLLDGGRQKAGERKEERGLTFLFTIGSNQLELIMNFKKYVFSTYDTTIYTYSYLNFLSFLDNLFSNNP